jgi:hypothetical protein
MGALIALQMLYPYFTDSMKANFREMFLEGGRDFANSPLNSGGSFRFFDDTNGVSDDASLIGAMSLFLYGIIPDTGYLAINASEERCQDMRTCFPVSEWCFDYADSMVRIPVMAGNLSFVFGSTPVTENFDSNGVYNVYFTSDWNNVTAIQKIADITAISLQPVTLQAIPKHYLNQTDTVTSPTPALSPSSNNQNNSTSDPSPTVDTTPTQTTLRGNPLAAYVIVLGVSIAAVLIGAVAFRFFYVKRRTRPIKQ